MVHGRGRGLGVLGRVDQVVGAVVGRLGRERGSGFSVGLARSSGPPSGTSGGAPGRGGSGLSVGLARSPGRSGGSGGWGGSGGVGGSGLPSGLVNRVSFWGDPGAAWAAVTGTTAASTAMPRAATSARLRALGAAERRPFRAGVVELVLD